MDLIDIGYKQVVVSNIGKLAYAIWKALNVRNNKIEQNVQTVQNSGINLEKEFPVGKKIQNFTLKLKDFQVSSFSAIDFHSPKNTYVLICDGPLSNLGFKYKVRLLNYNDGDNPGAELCYYLQKVKECEKSIESLEIEIEIESASILGTDPKWKTITFSRAKILKPTQDELDIMIDEIDKELEIKKSEKIKQEQEEKLEQERKEEESKVQRVADIIIKDMEPLGSDEEKLKEFYYEHVKNGSVTRRRSIYNNAERPIVIKAFKQNYKELTGKDFIE